MKTRWGRLVLNSMLLFFALLPASAQTEAGLSGEWRGMLGTLHLSFTFDQAAQAGLSGRMTSLDQGNVTIPIDSVSFAQGALHLELKAIGAVYDAKLSAPGDTLTGTWQQGAVNAPLLLHRPGSTPALTLKPRTIGQVALTPCTTLDGNTEGLCGTISVWENRSAKSGRTLALKLMVLPSTSDHPAPGAFFPLAGGPGQSALEAYPAMGLVNAIRKQRDIVLVDQRGTGESAPLLCELRDPKQAMGEDLPVERVKACREKLSKTADLTQYTTSIFADDLDEVRAALGYAKVDVFGASYGTRAALVYLHRHGEHVRTIALEAVVPPEYRIPGSFARPLQRSIDQVIARCAADLPCHTRYPALQQEFTSVLERLEKVPAQVEIQTAEGKQTVTISKPIFVQYLRPLLYLPQGINQFPYIVHKAYGNDFKIYAAVAVQLRLAAGKAINRNLSLSVSCSEDIPGTTEAMIREETAGTPLGDFQVRQYQNACAEWPHAAIPPDFHQAVRSSVPALFISGALDPATPPSISEDQARRLTNSQVLVLPNGTHGTGSACVDGILSSFVETATKVDTSCTAFMKLGDFLIAPADK